MDRILPAYPNASLYVGDLHPDVTEAVLYEKFSLVGPVLSIRVCRDMITRRSLGYAYVNFQNPADAEKALDNMNFDPVNGSPIRIMWSQRDPSLRKSGIGNIFIKNLDKSIDNKALYDTFSVFGNILSCKVATDCNGSKGYGFIHFESEEVAKFAIDKVNGMLMLDKKVFVGRFMSRRERVNQMGDQSKRYTNVFVKNFGEHLDNQKLKDLFECFGKILSCKVMTNELGIPKGFGFVCFEEHESALRAVEQLNGRELNGRELYVARAQKKAERQAELRDKFERFKANLVGRCHGVNLYVKNLDDSVNDEGLRTEFGKYGEISSVKVMLDGDRSKCFGFVCFKNAEDANRAQQEMNGRLVGSKPLYVALAQRKEERKAQLASQYQKRFCAYPQLGFQPGQFFTPGNSGFYISPNFPAQSSQNFYGQAQLRPSGRMSQHSRNERYQPTIGTVTRQARSVGQLPMRSNNNARPITGQHQPLSQNHRIASPAYQASILQSNLVHIPNNARLSSMAKYPTSSQITPQYLSPMLPLGSQQSTYVGGAGGNNIANSILMQHNNGSGHFSANAGYGQHSQQYLNPLHQYPSASGNGGVGMSMNQTHIQQQQQANQFQQILNNQHQYAGNQQHNQHQQHNHQQLGQQNQQQYGSGMSNHSSATSGANMNQQVLHIQGQEPLTSSMLSGAPASEQKQMIGERLYPVVQALYPDQAGKITGMLLEIDNSELLHMLDSRDLLRSKVEEAVAVLQAHNAKLASSIGVDSSNDIAVR